MLYLTLEIWYWYLTCLTPYTWDLTPVLDMLYLSPDTWHLISNTGTWNVILDTWSLKLDIWHQYLTYYHLTLDTWHLISDTGTWHVITWHLMHDTWYMTLNIWHAITYLICFHLVLVHLTWHCDTWMDIVIAGTCAIFPIHDYHFYGNLTWLLYCYQTSGTPELLCIWTLVFLSPYNRETPDIMLLTLYSCWSP